LLNQSTIFNSFETDLEPETGWIKKKIEEEKPGATWQDLVKNPVATR
jgi:hypothetical protein